MPVYLPLRWGGLIFWVDSQSSPKKSFLKSAKVEMEHNDFNQVFHSLADEITIFHLICGNHDEPVFFKFHSSREIPLHWVKYISFWQSMVYDVFKFPENTMNAKKWEMEKFQGHNNMSCFAYHLVLIKAISHSHLKMKSKPLQQPEGKSWKKRGKHSRELIKSPEELSPYLPLLHAQSKLPIFKARLSFNCHSEAAEKWTIINLACICLE